MTSARRGFTLTELLIAIILLAIAILGTASVVTGTSTTQTLSSRRGEMALLGTSRIETFRVGLDASDAAMIAALQDGGSLTTSLSGFWDVVTGPNGVPFVRRWLVEPGPALTSKVTVRVAPQTPSSRSPVAVDLVTYLLVP